MSDVGKRWYKVRLRKDAPEELITFTYSSEDAEERLAWNFIEAVPIPEKEATDWMGKLAEEARVSKS